MSAKVKSERIVVRLRPKDKAAVQAAADKADIYLAEWIRDVIVRAATDNHGRGE